MATLSQVPASALEGSGDSVLRNGRLGALDGKLRPLIIPFQLEMEISVERKTYQFGWIELNACRWHRCWVIGSGKGSQAEGSATSVLLGTSVLIPQRGKRGEQPNTANDCESGKHRRIFVTFGALIDRYMAEEMPERHSTRRVTKRIC